METSFFNYLQRLELMAFFSGYPLIFALVIFIFGNLKSKSGFGKRIASLLPLSYALVGTLFLGLQLKNLYPEFSLENMAANMNEPYLKIWGLISLLFWIPAVSKKLYLSLFHSFVFFFFIIKDLFINALHLSDDKNIISNLMKVYTDSLLLNLVAFLFILLVYFLFTRLKETKNHPVG